MRSRSIRLLVAASTVALFPIAGAPSVSAESVATCTSEVVDGIEVDYCVGNPNANTVTDVPGVNVDFEFGLGIGLGFYAGAPNRAATAERTGKNAHVVDVTASV
jgi:hypothetical protein